MTDDLPVATDSWPGAALAPPGWLCPFCALHCEPAGVEQVGDDGRLRLQDWPCERAEAGLAAQVVGTVGTVGTVQGACAAGVATDVAAMVAGRPVPLSQALAAAAAHLAAARLPLYGGLATDVAGMRALVRLANLTGGVLDHAQGDALMAGVRLLQDRGQFNTTLGELHARADLVLCIGTQPGTRMPAFWRRVGIAQAPVCAPASTLLAAAGPARRVVFLATGVDPALSAELARSRAGGAPPPAVPAAPAAPDPSVHAAPTDGPAVAVQAHALAPGQDLHTSLALLNAAALGRPVALPAPLAAVLAALQAARYAVILWEPAQASADGADAGLVAEALLRLTRTLNRATRAGVIALGGADGVQAVNQTHTWLTGLPLRTRLPALGTAQAMAHDPVLLGGARLWRDEAVDALVWVAATGAHLPPPPARPGVPRIVLGHPALASACAAPGTVFLPVAMPGIGAPGHDWRVDGFVALPLQRLSLRTADRGLPDVAETVAGIERALKGPSWGPPAADLAPMAAGASR